MERSAALAESRYEVLPAFTVNAVLIQIGLVAAAAVVLPSLAHLTGLPVRWLLPMHWPVILAGLCYGWRSGGLVGLLAPLSAFLISGMPPPHMLPGMSVELAAYGLLAGFARQVLGMNWFASCAIALIGGRIVFLASVLTLGSVSQPFGEYLMAAMLPGIPAAIAQLVVLSMAAKWCVERNSSAQFGDES